MSRLLGTVGLEFPVDRLGVADAGEIGVRDVARVELGEEVRVEGRFEPFEPEREVQDAEDVVGHLVAVAVVIVVTPMSRRDAAAGTHQCKPAAGFGCIAHERPPRELIAHAFEHGRWCLLGSVRFVVVAGHT